MLGDQPGIPLPISTSRPSCGQPNGSFPSMGEDRGLRHSLPRRVNATDTGIFFKRDDVHRAANT